MNFAVTYPTRRSPLLAGNVVATSQPLAAQAGLRMLLAGGNAVDAAIAAAITLTVVEPTSNGIGSDAFAIVWDGAHLHGLNASGRSPAALSADRFAGMTSMPLRGWDSVTVPGAVSAWVELHERFGRLPFERLFEPAIGYARDGFMVGAITARLWQRAEATFRDFPEFNRVFLPGGRAPAAGERFRNPDQAATLTEIASTRGESFYRGALADRIVAEARRGGGAMVEADLADHRADWVGTISTPYREHELHEIPPNGQGLAALMALGILRHHDMASAPVDSADSLHLQIEAMKLAFADCYRYVADPEHMELPVSTLLDDAYLAGRARLIDMRRAGSPQHGVPGPGGTVYLTAADETGMMVSFIQSNYHGFGSGVVVPGTGISLQNRGAGFVLKPGHPNRVAGGKRPFHTIIPAFLTKQGAPLMSFGVMGGPMQPQGHTQMVVRVVDYQQSPQAAADAPRWQVLGDTKVAVEEGFSPAVLADLTARGHLIQESSLGSDFAFGGAQLIYRTDGGYVAGSDPRKDGQAVGY
jgi:gamma-glutamyltranspeptidase/glutathione hydrolase